MKKFYKTLLRSSIILFISTVFTMPSLIFHLSTSVIMTQTEKSTISKSSTEIPDFYIITGELTDDNKPITLLNDYKLLFEIVKNKCKEEHQKDEMAEIIQKLQEYRAQSKNHVLNEIQNIFFKMYQLTRTNFWDKNQEIILENVKNTNPTFLKALNNFFNLIPDNAIFKEEEDTKELVNKLLNIKKEFVDWILSYKSEEDLYEIAEKTSSPLESEIMNIPRENMIGYSNSSENMENQKNVSIDVTYVISESSEPIEIVIPFTEYSNNIKSTMHKLLEFFKNLKMYKPKNKISNVISLYIELDKVIINSSTKIQIQQEIYKYYRYEIVKEFAGFLIMNSIRLHKCIADLCVYDTNKKEGQMQNFYISAVESIGSFSNKIKALNYSSVDKLKQLNKLFQDKINVIVKEHNYSVEEEKFTVDLKDFNIYRLSQDLQNKICSIVEELNEIKETFIDA